MTKIPTNDRKRAAIEANEFQYEVLKDASDENIGKLMDILTRAMPVPGDRTHNSEEIRSKILLAKTSMRNALKYSRIEKRKYELAVASECISRLEFFYREE